MALHHKLSSPSGPESPSAISAFDAARTISGYAIKQLTFYMYCPQSLIGVQCLPEDRVWPQKCERCIKHGHDCSPSLTAKDEHRQTNSSSGVQNAPLQAYVAQQQGQRSPRAPTANNWTGNRRPSREISTFVQHSYMLFDRLVSNPEPDPFLQPAPPSRCAEWFNEAIYLSWILITGGLSKPDHTRAQHEIPRNNPYQTIAWYFTLFYGMLEERLESIDILPAYEEMIKVGIDSGMREREAKEFAMGRIAAKNAPQPSDDGENEDHIAALHYPRYKRLLTQGPRWKRLIQATQSWEVLLLDGCFPPMNGQQCELSSVMLGPESSFLKYKEELLSPDLGLLETCERLHGTVNIFQRCIEMDKMGSSLGPLNAAQQFHSRIRTVLRRPPRQAVPGPSNNSERMIQSDGPSDDIEGDSATVLESSETEMGDDKPDEEVLYFLTTELP
ncbi:hypothetical protein VTN00DRAFT_3740 [Thermoascus crustaceus]|uniref:uncharacterized protein n=1 Tax=Thermoascus crustaceus TaxID=5088 RepID=UPI003743AC60